MGWNGSSNDGRVASDVGASKMKRPSRWKGLAAAAIVVVGAATAFLLVRRDVFDAPDADAAAKKIAVVKPSIGKIRPTSFIATNKAVRTAQFEKPVIEKADVFFDSKPKGRVVEWVHHEKPLFVNAFESFVGSVMTATPGERFLEIDLEDEFDEAFAASLTNRIEITAEDSDEVAAIKRAVIEAKEQVRKYVNQGMRPRDVVIEARDELNKIADYRDDLQEQFNQYLVTESNPDEVLKYVEEANGLLAEYGAMPLDAPDDIDSAYDALIDAKEEKIREIDEKSEMDEKESEEGE